MSDNTEQSSHSIESQIASSLDDYADQLTPDTLTRLRDARVAALSSLGKKNNNMIAWPGAAGLVAIAVLLAVSLHSQNSSPVVTPLLDDLDLLVTEDVEFYQQLEILQWMDTNEADLDV